MVCCLNCKFITEYTVIEKEVKAQLNCNQCKAQTICYKGICAIVNVFKHLPIDSSFK